jgi:L-malate glycosyltransferase
VIGGALRESPARWARPGRPKVVHVVVAGEVGGAERMLVDLASHPELSGADHVVALMTPNPRLSRLLASAGLAVRDRGPVKENAAAFLWRSLGPSDAAWLSEVLHVERADVVHLHTFGSQVVGTRAALRAGARVLRTEHSSRVYTDMSCWPFSRWSLSRADGVVAISRHIRQVVLARDPTVADRLALVGNGVDTARFAPFATSSREADRGATERSARAFAFVLVGRLERRKGVDVAIDALARVPEARLDVVGDGCERQALERHALEAGVAGRVRFHGHLDDTRDALARAQVALCSSREEGLGIALLEAMAMERPVVALPVGGVPEFVVDGKTGWLARDRTREALAARMRDAMTDEAQRSALGRAARSAVIDGYSMEAMCEGYGAVYAALARERPATASVAMTSPPAPLPGGEGW